MIEEQDGVRSVTVSFFIATRKAHLNLGVLGISFTGVGHWSSASQIPSVPSPSKSKSRCSLTPNMINSLL